MLAFLNKVFLDNEFQNNYTFETSTHTGFYYKQNQEYFVVSEYDKKDITKFFQSKRTSNIVGFLDNFKKEHPEFEWIDKDTSLIITLKVSDLEKDFEVLKNQIMKIEEDEYFFRKYIIIYDEKWEKGIENINTIGELNDELKWIDLDQFRDNNFTNSKWYLIIQLFIKLPFLKLEIEKIELENLSDRINQDIQKSSLDKLDNLIIKEEYLKSYPREEDFFKKLENSILDESNKEIDQLLDTLIK